MESAAEPPFHEELEQVWGARWGASDEVGVLRRVFVRRPGDELLAVRADAWDERLGALVDPLGRGSCTDGTPPDRDKVRVRPEGLIEAWLAEAVVVEVAEP